MLVRRSKGHAVRAVIERVGGAVRLVRVEPHTGPLPEVAHLVGQVFPDHAAVRRALLAAMSSETGDTLDNVLLSQAAYEQWLGAATRAARARPMPSGELLIWVDLPNGQRVEARIPPGEWTWRRRPS